MAFDLLSALYLVAFVLSGVAIARVYLSKERPLVRLWLGGVIALLLLIWLPALFSLLLGFTLLSQLLALAVAVCFGTLCAILAKNKPVMKNDWLSECDVLFTLLPLLVIGIVLLSTHTILPVNGGLSVGQSTYGDLAMHLGFITSIAEQHTFPPMYSICPDTPVGYPFLSDSISSTFYALGADLRFATMLPAMYAYALVLLGVYLFFERYLKDRATTRLATLLFFLGGGFGFAYCFDLLQQDPGKLTRFLTAFYETPTNNVTVGVKWVNPIADMLIPQRATLFGWAFLFPCLYLLYRAAFEQDRKSFTLLGILAGGLPLIHTHSFLALGVISAVYLFRSILRNEEKAQWLGYLRYALIVAVLAGPQLLLFTFRQSGSFLHFNWNWANETDSFLWFYVKNLGLLFLLLPAALLGTSKRHRAILSGAGVLWLLAETIQFQPNPYDNNKLLFVCFAFLCGLIAEYLMRIYRSLRKAEGGRALSTKLLAVFVTTALFLSGTMTLAREYNSEYELLGPSEVAAAEFVKESTAPNATFLTSNNHNNAIAALTGRNIVCGSGSYLYYHGVNYADREQALYRMYEEPTEYFAALSAKYHVDYVYFSSQEFSKFNCDLTYFEENCQCVYNSGGILIYAVSPTP